MPLKEQSVKKQAVSGYYFSIASIKSSKDSSKYNKIGEAPKKSNISENIRKKLKSLLGLSTGARRSCLKKKTRGEKSGGTVPLRVGKKSNKALKLALYLNVCVALLKYQHYIAKYQCLPLHKI